MKFVLVSFKRRVAVAEAADVTDPLAASEPTTREDRGAWGKASANIGNNFLAGGGGGTATTAVDVVGAGGGGGTCLVMDGFCLLFLLILTPSNNVFCPGIVPLTLVAPTPSFLFPFASLTGSWLPFRVWSLLLLKLDVRC